MSEPTINPDDYIYGLNERPPWYALTVLGFQHLIKFALLLVCPVLILNTAQASAAVMQQVISISLICASLTTFLMALRNKIGAGCFIPAQASVSYFAIALLAAKIGGMALVFSTTIVAGILQIGWGLLLKFFKPIFDRATIGFIILMLGLWATLLGVSELFYPGNLGQLIVHGNFSQNSLLIKSSLIGFIALFLMLIFRLIHRTRISCILLGMLSGWLLALFSNQLLPEKLLAVKQAAWLNWPHFVLPHYQFQLQFILPLIFISLLASFELAALIVAIQNLEQHSWTAPNFQQIRRGNIIAGASLIGAGLLGGTPQSPVPGSIGDLIITGAHSRIIAYFYSIALLLLAFSPKLAFLALTVPAAVNGAAIVFMGATMIMKGFSLIEIENLAAHHLLAFCIAFLLGLGTDMLPSMYNHHSNPIPWFTNTALAVGLFSYLILRYLFSLGQANE